ncbi:MAG: hypothetical protein WBG32_02430 [Nodosilinea sp.]
MKYIQWLSIGLSLAMVSAAVGLGDRATAQTAPVHLSLSQTVIDFFNRDDVEDRSRGGAGTSRGPGEQRASEPFCILTPGRNETIWHQQPLFVTNGPINRIAVRQKADDRTQPDNPEIWSYSPRPDADLLIVAKTDPLQPGNRYEWLFYNSLDDNVIFLLSFTVMPAGEERDQITTDLAQLEAELTQEGASIEAIAQAQADYFLAKDMPADALQILFAVEEPSADLVALRTETVETICSFRLGRS